MERGGLLDDRIRHLVKFEQKANGLVQGTRE